MMRKTTVNVYKNSTKIFHKGDRKMKEREVWMGRIMAALESLNERALSLVYFFILRLMRWNEKKRGKLHKCVRKTTVPRRRETVFYCGGRSWSLSLTFDKY